MRSEGSRPEPGAGGRRAGGGGRGQGLRWGRLVRGRQRVPRAPSVGVNRRRFHSQVGGERPVEQQVPGAKPRADRDPR